MSSSSRAFGEGDNSRVEIPVFVNPAELVFDPNKRRCFLTIYNPYGNEAQFRIMTTSPDRFDVSTTKGIIKQLRRVDVTVRLLSNHIDELPEPTEEPQTIDYFRVSLQVGQLKGNKPVRVIWCRDADIIESSDKTTAQTSGDEKSLKSRNKLSRSTSASSSTPLVPSTQSSSQRNLSNQRVTSIRPIRQTPHIDHAQGGSNVNLVCTLCAIACVIMLFLPLSIDADFCKKVRPVNSDSTLDQNSLVARVTALLSITYEVKLGASFALGLFTYRLISTLPD